MELRVPDKDRFSHDDFSISETRESSKTCEQDCILSAKYILSINVLHIGYCFEFISQTLLEIQRVRKG
jgi:hypothetical protein